MIDNTLVRMIDEMLRSCRESSVFGRSKMLEVRTSRAHLVELRAFRAHLSKPQGFRS
jgi:hypothetical protein